MLKLFKSCYRNHGDKTVKFLNSTAKMIHLQVGQTVTIKRTVTQAVLEQFMKISGDCNEVHMQKPALVHGALLNSFVSAVIGTRLPGHGTLLLGQNLRFPNPCYLGEEITIVVTIESVKKIVVCSFNCSVIDDINSPKAVLTGTAKLLCKS
nr:PREDICTED: hydroxyacyl-thioester dehydratase type 2, mitochondrial-like [Bemisia tabaci]